MKAHQLGRNGTLNPADRSPTEAQQKGHATDHKWLAAQGRKSWPRWVLTVSLVLSVISLVQIIGASGLQFDSAIEIVSCALTAAGLYCSFTGDAKGWFNA